MQLTQAMPVTKQKIIKAQHLKNNGKTTETKQHGIPQSSSSFNI